MKTTSNIKIQMWKVMSFIYYSIKLKKKKNPHVVNIEEKFSKGSYQNDREKTAR